MPKDRRGGRSLKKQPYNDYDLIGDANNGKISVLKSKSDTDNASVPQFSNKTNTTYFITKDVGGVDKVTSIAVYRNRKVVYNIDIDPAGAHHYHTLQAETLCPLLLKILNPHSEFLSRHTSQTMKKY